MPSKEELVSTFHRKQQDAERMLGRPDYGFAIPHRKTRNHCPMAILQRTRIQYGHFFTLTHSQRVGGFTEHPSINSQRSEADVFTNLLIKPSHTIMCADKGSERSSGALVHHPTPKKTEDQMQIDLKAHNTRVARVASKRAKNPNVCTRQPCQI